MLLNDMQNRQETEKNIPPRIKSKKFEALGTEVDIQLVVKSESEEKKSKEIFKSVIELYKKYSAIFSRFDSESELGKLNTSLGEFKDASAEMREVVNACLGYNIKTGGIFDPRVIEVLEQIGYKSDFKNGVFAKNAKQQNKSEVFSKSLEHDLRLENDKVYFGARMDFSGIAKGYITDKIVEFLANQGWHDFLVDSGGDMYMSGHNEKGGDWIIGVEGMDDRKAVLSFSNMGVATSGISRRKWEIEGERFHHLINPKNDQNFCFDLKSVTVMGDSVEFCDIWAKVLFLMGKHNGIELAKKHEMGAVFLDCRGNVAVSRRVKEFLIKL